ncbi:hypothetical protein QFZ75_000009 [Streptomyces sp. V3I8]|uniref:hypothetical protein n=1 Tax=Streptomyces sp. V3I8 TaxID=3042279 RepID=UPI002789DB09|nr:hypothetical protein [Streptomyces sp. V3I8]MDQ1033593.1 hypothetical protein [Streptomyces sp. V3I8]
MNTDRRTLGTGPNYPADTELGAAPRAQFAAERLPPAAAAEPKPRPAATGRRVLGAGPAALGGDSGGDMTP